MLILDRKCSFKCDRMVTNAVRLMVASQFYVSHPGIDADPGNRFESIA
jgi:hypothetical protein